MIKVVTNLFISLYLKILLCDLEHQTRTSLNYEINWPLRIPRKHVNGVVSITYISETSETY